MARSTLGALLLFVASTAAVAGFDINEVGLGASEEEIKAKFKEANCRELEWTSRVADRRCDDSRVKVGGIDASVTFYLKRGAIEGYDVRFDKGQFKRMSEFLAGRYGKPAAEKTSGLGSIVEWKNKGERARLSAEQGRRRASLLVWRGAFEDEIYKVR